MTITNVKYTDLDSTQVKITLDDGREMFAGVTGGTWLHAELNEWLNDNTPEPWKTEQEIQKETYDTCISNRQNAYKTESDPLKIEAEYDAMKNGTEPNYTKWMEKVAEIKARYPFLEVV